MSDHIDQDREMRRSSVFASAPGLVLLGFLFVAGALLFTEHHAHAVLGGFIWLILVAVLFFPTFTQGGWRRRGSS